MSDSHPPNPFPGLRPFREEEEYLFFGRENQVDAMVDKLAAHRFLAVVGTSGSGKSSLVNCGLRPALHGGLMASAGTAWRMAQFRPGSDPIGSMAGGLTKDGKLFHDAESGDLPIEEIVETTLRMSKLGLVDIYEQARLPEGTNLLIVADQFEELFRFRRFGQDESEEIEGISEDAIVFVNLLLEAAQQKTCPIYVVLTMRSDFLGDCVHFNGLAESINSGQYLVPRMTRDERRAAIGGPVAVSGAEISPVLLTRLVNDVGDNPDQLSILQHALNRTWAKWEHEGQRETPLDLPHYKEIGTMANALDHHAEKAFAELETETELQTEAELKTERRQQICEKIFKALTDKATDPRGVRRPTDLKTLCALTNASAEEVISVIDVFRHPSRSFLMPPAGEELRENSVIDISHETLLRVWKRLGLWADEEARSARSYHRLVDTATLHADGKAGLWRDPDLSMALAWREKEQPSASWASRYQDGFESAMQFLNESKRISEKEKRRRKNRRVRILWTAPTFLILLFVVYYINDLQKTYGDWEMVFEEDFTDGNIEEAAFLALDKNGDQRPEVWEETDEGVRLLKDQWIWIEDKSIRGNAKIVVKLHYEGDFEGFQACLNGNQFEQLKAAWDANPIGYACRYGSWGGTMAAITANERAVRGDFNNNFPIETPPKKSFLLTFQRQDGIVSLSIDNNQIHQESVLLPLVGARGDVGFRTWCDSLFLESIQIFRYTYPIEVSPIMAGDALVEIKPEAAIEQYLMIAEDNPSSDLGTLALTKAIQWWFRTYEGRQGAPKQNQLWDRIEKSPEYQKFQNPSKQDRLLPRLKRFLKHPGGKRQDTGQMLASIVALNHFGTGEYDKALNMFPEIVARNEDTRIAIKCLQFDHQAIPKETVEELLPWIARTPKVFGLDLHSLQLKDIRKLNWIENLKFLDIRDNEVTTLKSIEGKHLKALYCMNNKITSLEPLQLMKLDELWCGGNQITDISPLTEMNNMHTLSCRDNQISDLSPLRGRPKTGYFYFDCSENKIKSIEALRDIGLSVLYCSNNMITDLSPLAGKSDLYKLDCSGNEIADIAPLANVPIKTLICSNNRISDLSPLAGKTDLYFLNCANNPIRDLSPLKTVPVETLDISGTKVISIAPLIGHKHLRALTCSSEHEIPDLELLGTDVKIKRQ